MTKINLIFNENRRLQGERARIERMDPRRQLQIVEDSFFLASAQPGHLWYDPQRRRGCLWAGTIDNLDELGRQLPEQTAQDNPAKRLDRLYEQRGETLAEEIIGSFILIFIRDHQLHVLRDPMGVGILYYVHKPDGEWIFSDRIHSILSEGSLRPVLNRQSLMELMAMGPGASEGKTLLKNICELPMGHRLRIDGRKSELREVAGVHLQRHTEDLATTQAHVRELVCASLNRQMASGSIRAAFLSGGLDSSILCALAYRNCLQLQTVSLDYEENDRYFQGYAYQTSRDAEYIQTMLQRYPTRHRSLTIPQRQCSELLQEAMIAREGPGMADIDSSLLWMYRQVVQDVPSILTGECSDELFGGYPWFYRSDLVNLDGFPWLQSLPQRVRLLKKPLNELDFEGYLMQAYRQAVSRIPQDPSDSQQDRRARKMTWLTVHGFMQTLLKRQETLAAHTGLIVRAPFCDFQLYQYLYNVPWAMKYCDGQEKGLLRRAFADLLPDTIAQRKKNPYPKTYHPAYTEAVQRTLRNLIAQPDCALLQLLDYRALDELIASGGGSFPKPWFGQLMMGPQLLAYLIQIELWIREEGVQIEL